jgi:hypothetical protein
MNIKTLVLSLVLAAATPSCKDKGTNSEVEALRYDPSGSNAITPADVRKYLTYRTAIIEGLREVLQTGSASESPNKKAFAKAVDIMLKNMTSGANPIVPVPFFFASVTDKPLVEWRTELKSDEKKCYDEREHRAVNAPGCEDTIVARASKACGSISGRTLCEELYWWIFAANGRKCLGLAKEGIESQQSPCTSDNYPWSSAQVRNISVVRQQNQDPKDVIKNYQRALFIEAVISAIKPNSSDQEINEVIARLSQRSLTLAEVKNIVRRFDGDMKHEPDSH